MIISCHIAKTGGTTFRKSLIEYFGDRVFFDYGDGVGQCSPDAEARRAARLEEIERKVPELRQSYAVIHGHFFADKYLFLFPGCRVAAFFRDPVERVVSNFHFILRNPQLPHPFVCKFHERKMNLEAFIESHETQNIQASFLRGMTVDDLSFCGISEQFNRSLKLFNAIFDTSLRETTAENVNPQAIAGRYQIDRGIRQLIECNNQRDIEIYARAKERFECLAACYLL